MTNSNYENIAYYEYTEIITVYGTNNWSIDVDYLDTPSPAPNTMYLNVHVFYDDGSDQWANLVINIY